MGACLTVMLARREMAENGGLLPLKVGKERVPGFPLPIFPFRRVRLVDRDEDSMVTDNSGWHPRRKTIEEHSEGVVRKSRILMRIP